MNVSLFRRVVAEFIGTFWLVFARCSSAVLAASFPSNPRIIFGSIEGFSEGSPYADLKVYDNVAQCAGRVASTRGFWDGPPIEIAA
jgi:CoA-transferase family III